MSKTNIQKSKEKLLQDIKEHKQELTSVIHWDGYAKEHNLPSSGELIHLFGSWNAVKSSLSLPVFKRGYTEKELLEIAISHKDKFKSKSLWNEYYKKNNLPSPNTYINVFGSWKAIQQKLGIDGKERKDIYSKTELIGVLKKHKDYYVNRKQWDIYAKENRLPTYKTILKHLNHDEILFITGKQKVYNNTEEELISIAINHFEHFTSMKAWNDYASELKLPTAYTYIRRFGTWNKAKHKVRLRYFEEEPDTN